MASPMPVSSYVVSSAAEIDRRAAITSGRKTSLARGQAGRVRGAVGQLGDLAGAGLPGAGLPGARLHSAGLLRGHAAASRFATGGPGTPRAGVTTVAKPVR